MERQVLAAPPVPRPGRHLDDATESQAFGVRAAFQVGPEICLAQGVLRLAPQLGNEFGAHVEEGGDRGVRLLVHHRVPEHAPSQLGQPVEAGEHGGGAFGGQAGGLGQARQRDRGRVVGRLVGPCGEVRCEPIAAAAEGPAGTGPLNKRQHMVTPVAAGLDAPAGLLSGEAEGLDGQLRAGGPIACADPGVGQYGRQVAAFEFLDGRMGGGGTGADAFGELRVRQGGVERLFVRGIRTCLAELLQPFYSSFAAARPTRRPRRNTPVLPAGSKSP
ncbi:hypothetical protein SLUN_37635 [Streptomyces lunaelactis]|uniref:Uncharacterized protein n=1 Tax=Streptomyces lunaelactis TaxID=1535768 RepID=A0A2R4TD35_9ACTN|nr:hypothetical protein SLUN_37635 [Streptomyces lunaelactis]